MKLFLVITLLLAGCAHLEPESRQLTANPAFGILDPDPSETRMVIVPQWHLSPDTTTRTTGAPDLPQTKNQLAIYHQLSDWIRDRGLQTVIAEGCEGTIDTKFTDRYNGWTLADLKTLKAEELDVAMTHVALKLKAEFKNKLKVVCGDDLKLIKKHQLILSDLRGLLGFKLRLVQSRGDKAKYATYLRALNPLLDLSPQTKSAVTESVLNQRLKDLVADFDKVVHERNTVFLSAIHKAMGRTAVIIGALHIKDLVDRMHAEGEAPAVFTPAGLKGDEAQLIEEIRALLAKSL